MNKSLFMRIVDRLSNEVPYFCQTQDVTGRSGLSTLQKCTAAICVLAYGSAFDAVDEYIRLAASTARIDCMHWEWKNCPTSWKGQFSRGSEKPTIVLEAVADYDLWIWHAFFGLPGTLNDINILDRSPVFDDIIHGQALQVNFWVNGNPYSMVYYLTDGIYPKWATFIQSYHFHKDGKQFYLLKLKKLSEKMSSVLSESCKHDLPLSKIQHVVGTYSRLGRL
ncbi:uncharacterized protein LOC130498979 [Raphanus sativus]|uniref:Uncharacterized protein LOC130498979 n=1 Tax=Raphanus sativus TaxID=3726 RepID=A0A9W3CBE0_RAPSA|nr:uncharacterized protein LOC130498979 [Raphanus sativus]